MSRSVEKTQEYYRRQRAKAALTPCTVADCGAPGHTGGLCRGHYRRLRDTGDVQAAQPIQGRGPRIDVRGEYECWEWLRARARNGYGVFRREGKNYRAHRAVWELANGCKVPAGAHVLHRCDNRACVNPAHLFLGTHQDNMRDMVSKGRAVWQRGVTD